MWESLAALVLCVGSVEAANTVYRVGDLLTDFIDVVSFQAFDAISALDLFFYLIPALIVFYVIYKKWLS